ncbi:MAG: family 78 glycoside hydrolase catalytic domain, partial [Acidobacteria bacterium]|nr:family 78 glycoside hydrolase catalytic domain [Acidobacteriota bacterium]
MKIGELLGSDGLVREDTVGGNIYDSYTLSGNGLESWHPKFAYHGFRYVQVTGLPAPPARNTLSAIPLRGANEVAGTFTSSNTLFNEIHAIIRRAIESNMFSIFTDCPDREKLGWLGDMIGIFGSITRNFDVAAYMTTILDNMADSQVASGMVPTFVPTYADYSIYGEGFRDDVNWGSALILAPWYLYETYGDRRPMEKHYDGMQRYFNYLASRAKGSLLDYGLGDWISPDTRMPREVIATYGLYRCTVAMQRVASVLGREEDAAFYERYAADVAAAFNAKYLNRERHYYADGQQAADAIALDMGVVPEDEKAAVLAHLIATIRADGNHFRAGIVSLQAILRALHNAGRDDVICDAAVQTTAPSYGFQVVKGATTLTEEWSGPEVGASQNHMMLGAIDEWFNAGLAGIQQAPDSVGYREVVIRPAIVGDLQHVRGAYNSVRGLIQSEWTRDDSGRVRMTVTLPAGVTGTVHVPTAGGFEARRVGPGFHEFTGTAAPPFTAGGSAGPSRERRRARRDSLQWRDPAPWPAPPVRRIR